MVIPEDSRRVVVALTADRPNFFLSEDGWGFFEPTGSLSASPTTQLPTPYALTFDPRDSEVVCAACSLNGVFTGEDGAATRFSSLGDIFPEDVRDVFVSYTGRKWMGLGSSRHIYWGDNDASS